MNTNKDNLIFKVLGDDIVDRAYKHLEKIAFSADPAKAKSQLESCIYLIDQLTNEDDHIAALATEVLGDGMLSRAVKKIRDIGLSEDPCVAEEYKLEACIYIIDSLHDNGTAWEDTCCPC